MEIRWKDFSSRKIGVAKYMDDDEHVLSFAGYERCEDEDFTDDDYDGALVEVWKPKDDWFCEVRWCLEDLECALENNNIPPTKNNIKKLYSRCQHHSFEDSMVEDGWNYIQHVIEFNEWEKM